MSRVASSSVGSRTPSAGLALLCRATDASGAVQPLDQPWNRQGMVNNVTQHVDVFVRWRDPGVLPR